MLVDYDYEYGHEDEDEENKEGLKDSVGWRSFSRSLIMTEARIASGRLERGGLPRTDDVLE